MEIGNRIKIHRVQLGMPQDQLAASVYCPRQTISSWENGKMYPDIQSLLLLSERFGVTLDEPIEGDVEVMQGRIDGDVKAIWRAGLLMWIGFLLTFATSVWFAMQIGPWLGDLPYHINLATRCVLLSAFLGWRRAGRSHQEGSRSGDLCRDLCIY